MPGIPPKGPRGRGPLRSFRPTRSFPVGAPIAPTPAPVGPSASRVYPRLLQHKRFARNGHIPESGFITRALAGLDHVLAYRRKTFFSVGDYINTPTSALAETTRYRFRCHAGYAARYLSFKLGLGLALQAGGQNASDPIVRIAVTDVASGAVSSSDTHHGLNTGGVTGDYPYQITERNVRIGIIPNRTYEVAISTIDCARIIDCVAYEEAAPNVDPSLDFFAELAAGAVGAPIWDATRQRLLQGLSGVWRRNGMHLLTVPTCSNVFGTTTFTNILDGGTGAPDATTAGYYLGDGGRRNYGPTGNITLEQLARVSGNKTIDVILAVHGSAPGGASTGELRLQNAAGTVASITGIGATSKWYEVPTTLASVDLLAKVDIQARCAAIGTFTLNAVSLYAYLA